MSKPVLTDSGERLYSQLAPTFFPEDEQHGWAGALYCSALAKMKDPAAEVVQPQGSKPPYAILFEPQACPVAWLPWVAQFVGVEPAAIKALIALGQVTLAREWIEHPINQLRGTVNGMELAAKATLTGTKTLFFYVTFSGEAFVIKAATLTTQTPSEQATKEAIESMMPAWSVLKYETVSGGTLAILEAAHAKLLQTESAHATLSDLELHPEL